MAKKPMTKGQIVGYLADKAAVPKKAMAAILDNLTALAESETKKAGAFTLPDIGKLVEQGPGKP